MSEDNKAAEAASAETPSKKVLGPRRFYCFEYQKDELEYLGFHANHIACADTHEVGMKGSPREHQWLLVETEANKWIMLVRSHPEDTAFFALNYETGQLEYFGDYPNREAAIAARIANGDPDELKYEIMQTEKLREWKTHSSEGEKVPLTPFSYDHYEKNAAAAEAELKAAIK